MKQIFLILILALLVKSIEFSASNLIKGRACMRISSSMISDQSKKLENTLSKIKIDRDKLIKKIRYDAFSKCFNLIDYEDAINILKLIDYYPWTEFSEYIDINIQDYFRMTDLEVSQEIIDFEEKCRDEEKKFMQKSRQHKDRVNKANKNSKFKPKKNPDL
ncbi:hypothetical protein SteCoe_15824 [Stentor coeruleus]|uniref:Uncharacterized protein n=1 Tax=Stentor coeruleus TaxID=5963 RepID=A0A1R2C2X7_9CILI|nr:hypothetical protein SteCoe_15824 [Stentor coeruleus]